MLSGYFLVPVSNSTNEHLSSSSVIVPEHELMPIQFPEGKHARFVLKVLNLKYDVPVTVPRRPALALDYAIRVLS